MKTPERSAIPSDLERFLSLIWKPDEVREVRILKHNKYGHTASGYFDSPDKLAAAITRWDGKANCYVTLNPVDPAFLARANNRIITRAEHTTADADILSYHWLFLDIDPVRPSGISSTDSETAQANDVLDALISYLSRVGWPAPITALSGNGYYALFPIDLPNTSASTELIKRLLARLADQFDTNPAHLDPTVYNPARIAGLIGTLKVKGDATPDRPHRRASILQVPEKLIPVTVAQLDLVAGNESEEVHQKSDGKDHRAAAPLAQLFQDRGIAFRAQPPDASGVTWYHVQQCPLPSDGHAF